MVERAASAAKAHQSVTLAVNIRNFQVPPPPANAPGGDQVRLNDREQGVLHWDDKLTLEFSNIRPCVDGLDIVKADDIPTGFLADDSTVTDQPREPTTSRGQMLARFFTPYVAIANHSESGETLKSFITGLRPDKILSQMKKGDYLFIPFSHNDQKENWPQTYVEPFTTHKAYLKVLIAAARRFSRPGDTDAAAEFRRAENPQYSGRVSRIRAADGEGGGCPADRSDEDEYQFL